MMYYIYVFQHKKSNKLYVGKTNNFDYRLSKHKQASKKPKYYFHKALAKHGIDAFNYFIIEEWESEQDCLEAEIFWIEFFRSNYPEYGYNLTEGGEGSSGYKHTPESIAKLRIVNANKTLGMKHSIESITLMRVAKLADHDKNSLLNSGELNPNSKLTSNKVVEIRKLLKEKQFTGKEIAIMFQVSETQISKIKKEKTWQSLPKTSE